MRKLLIPALAVIAAACTPAAPDQTTTATPGPDATMAALMAAAPEECPEGEMQIGAITGGPTEAIGITEELMNASEMNGAFTGNVVRLRRIIIAPGGVVPWHNHDERQGMGLIVSGVFTEYLNNCRVPIPRGPGSISREIEGVYHYWRNEGDEPVLLIAADVVPQ
jgi:quercetin dioxygenase-like cupin family protein